MDAKLLDKPRLYEDERGFFNEVYHLSRDYQLGIKGIQQVSVARSNPNVLRGLHYQLPDPQGKLVACLEGEIWDAAVDVRYGSPDFGKNYCCKLTAQNGHRLWVPPGFAHGYYVVGSEPALVLYMSDVPYFEERAKRIIWNDTELHIPWPCSAPTLSAPDQAAPALAHISFTQLPKFEKPPKQKVPKPLNGEEIGRVVDMLNELLVKLPRISANLVLAEVSTSLEEIASAYQPAKCVPGTEDYERMIEWRQHSACGSPVVGLPELLSVICHWNLNVRVRWKDGRPKLEVVRQ